MTTKIILVLWDSCGACKNFQQIWPSIKGQLDNKYGGSISYGVHVLTNRGMTPPLDGPLRGINVQPFPTLIVLGPDEQGSNYQLNMSNIQPGRVIQGSTIAAGQRDSTPPLNWLMKTIDSKMSQAGSPTDKPPVHNPIPPNKILVSTRNSNVGVISSNSSPYL